MKKTSLLIALALAAALLLSVTAFADQRVFDNADLFSQDEEAQLEEMVAAFIGSSGEDMYILTAPESDDAYDSPRERADYFLLDRGYGTSEDGAIIYLIDMCYRQDYISTAGVMIDYVNDSRMDDIYSDTSDGLHSGDFAAAAGAFVNGVSYWYAQGIPSGQYRYDESTGEVYQRYEDEGFHISFDLKDIIILLVLAAAGFFIPRWVVKSNYELRGSTYHYDYSGNSKVDITGRSDKYLNTTVVRTPRAQDNDSDSGGSSTHSTGGGTFGGHSGNSF